MNRLLPGLQQTIDRLSADFQSIPTDRIKKLLRLTEYIVERKKHDKKSELIFICTHNSRRSHISQIWASAAAAASQHGDVRCYSGGTEVTAFHPNAIEALRRAGFSIEAPATHSDNPIYPVSFSEKADPLACFSKLYDDAANPQSDFAAVMTCSQADAECPYIPGAYRISLPFEDPKRADGDPDESTVYDQTVDEIGREMLYAFSMIAERM